MDKSTTILIIVLTILMMWVYWTAQITVGMNGKRVRKEANSVLFHRNG